MRCRLEIATPADALEIAALRNAVAGDLTRRHGPGPWSGQCTDRGVQFDQRHGRVYVLRQRSRIVATLVLATRKPWAIDRAYFTPGRHQLYLTGMAVLPGRQRRGLGRVCLEQAERIAREWPADAICLDAYAHPAAGAGDFYRRCGYCEVGRRTYRGAALAYFENLLGPPAGK